MRTCSLLLVLAASLPAAELTLDELTRQAHMDSGYYSADRPFRTRAGVQSIATDTDIDINGNKFSLGEDTSLRTHAEGLVLIQPMRNRPGLILGAGLSRTVVNVTDDLGQTATCIDGLLGLTYGLTPDNQWRIDAIGYAGFGWGTLADDLDGKAREAGLEVALNFPLVRSWNLEGAVSVGYSQISFDPGSYDVVFAGNTYPVDLELTSSGPSFGLALLWRP